MQKFHLELLFQIIGIGASSGIILHKDSLFLISDSSSYLYEYKMSTDELEKIKLQENSAESIIKKIKPDFESMLKTKKTIQIFGSGSTENRMVSYEYDLNTKETKKLNLTDLYKKIVASTGINEENLNIEGILEYKKNWFLFQRGNGFDAKNGIIKLENSLVKPKSIHYMPIKLPEIKSIATTFTDAVLVNKTIYFLAAAENTDSTYADGEVTGSLFGAIDITTFEVLFTEEISDSHKFEGLTVYKNHSKEISFLLCEDNDSEELKSSIYKLTIKKTTR